MPSSLTAHLVGLIAQAEAGVDFSPRTGAKCPCCGRTARIYKTMPWDGTVRVRYHRCNNPSCLLAAVVRSIKSVQVDG